MGGVTANFVSDCSYSGSSLPNSTRLVDRSKAGKR